MEREKLVILRNLLETDAGEVLLEFFHNHITEEACKLRDALEIKGMCSIVQQLKDVPKKVEKFKE